MIQQKVHIDKETSGAARLKRLGGSDRDGWNMRLANLVAAALPLDHEDKIASDAAVTAVLNGMADMNPADPIEGALISQLIAANEAALSLYRRGWSQPPEYFEARTKYLTLANKAARTVAVLAERLDQHRGRGQQQIVVKHVTVNADQAVVADQVVTGKPATERPAHGPRIAAGAEKPMEPLRDVKTVPEATGRGADAK